MILAMVIICVGITVLSYWDFFVNLVDSLVDGTVDRYQVFGLVGLCLFAFTIFCLLCIIVFSAYTASIHQG